MSQEIYQSWYREIKGYPLDQLDIWLRSRLFEKPNSFPPINPRGEIHVDFIMNSLVWAEDEGDTFFISRIAGSLGQLLESSQSKPVFDREDTDAFSNAAIVLPRLAVQYRSNEVPNPASSVKNIVVKLVRPEVSEPPKNLDPNWRDNQTAGEIQLWREQGAGKLLLYALSRIQPVEDPSEEYLNFWLELWDHPTRSDLWTFAYVGLTRRDWTVSLERLSELGQRSQRKDVDRSWTPSTSFIALVEEIYEERSETLLEWFVQRAEKLKEGFDPDSANDLALLNLIRNPRTRGEATILQIKERVEQIIGS